jgi:hypothetical protein
MGRTIVTLEALGRPRSRRRRLCLSAATRTSRDRYDEVLPARCEVHVRTAASTWHPGQLRYLDPVLRWRDVRPLIGETVGKQLLPLGFVSPGRAMWRYREHFVDVVAFRCEKYAQGFVFELGCTLRSDAPPHPEKAIEHVERDAGVVGLSARPGSPAHMRVLARLRDALSRPTR